ncbi:MAG: TetR/AcrR family transcriptional regulator [Xanthomonadaceae bacterium]|nr:TetR/AcrR family transcriptional regulator [Xanthomonadaceae bacterium]
MHTHTDSTACDDLAGAARILSAAQHLFAEKGFAAVSMHEIAQHAGVSKSNVFHHFRSKDELYLAVLGAACTSHREQLVPLLSGDEPFGVRLQRIMHADLEFMFAEPERAQLVLREITGTKPDDAVQPAPALLRDNAAALVAQMRIAQQNGEIRAEIDPAAVALLFLAANKFYFLTRNLIRHFPDVDFADDHGRYVEKIADLILHGVLPQEGVPK